MSATKKTFCRRREKRNNETIGEHELTRISLQIRVKNLLQFNGGFAARHFPFMGRGKKNKSSTAKYGHTQIKTANYLCSSVFICGQFLPRRLCRFACLRLIFLLLILAFSINAQTVSGTITDAQNAPVENAEVNLINKGKIVSRSQTNDGGEFSLAANNEKDLILRVEAKNFAVFEKRLSDLQIPIAIVLQPQNLREDVTVSITKTESRLSETPASIVILNRETLQNTAAQSIDDRLRQIAGFNLFRRGSSKTTNPTAQGANLRGVSGSGAARTSVELDGISLNDAFGGWTYWTRVPKVAVEQAEVLRGGASAIYGDAALSGAINLRTKSFEEKPILRFETSGGAQKTFDGSTFGAIGKNGWNASASFDAFETAGYIPVAENERGLTDSNANSRYENGFLTIEKRFNEKSLPQGREEGKVFENARIFLRGNYFTERRDNGTRLTTNQTRFRQLVSGADFSVKKIGAFEFRSSIEKQIYDQTFSSVSLDRNTENLTRIQRVPSQAFDANLFYTRAFGNHAVSSSGEFREVRGASDETIVNNNRATSLVGAGGSERDFGFFVQDFWRATRKLNLNFGARFDDWKNFDALSATRNLSNQQTIVAKFPDRSQNALSPRVGVLFQINQNFSLYAAFSKSFRASTLNELYRAFRVGNILTQANETLRAERAETFETGVNFTGFANRLSARGNFFVTEVSNPVVSITLTTTPSLITRQRQNVGRTRSRGIELDAEFAPRENLRFSASYLLVDARVADFPANTSLVGKRLPQVPKQQLDFQTFYRPTSKISLSLQARFSTASFEDDLNTLQLRPFATFDAFASYRVKKGLEIFASAENIFDNRYDIGLTPNRTVAAPRFARIGLRFDLNNK